MRKNNSTKANWNNRTIWTGDNLNIMQGMDSNCVDLIYLDPPFNSNRNYIANEWSYAKDANFTDTWKLDNIEMNWYSDIEEMYPSVYSLLKVVAEIHSNSMANYLLYISIRMIEMQRILKDTGSIYLHCDPTSSHYLKLIMDGIFKSVNHVSQVVWKRSTIHNLSKTGFDTVSDIILVYGKDLRKIRSNFVSKDSSIEEIHKKFPFTENETGRKYQHLSLEHSPNKSSAGQERNIQGHKIISKVGWLWSQDTIDKRLLENEHVVYWTKNNRPRFKIYLDEYKGTPIGNIWTDISHLGSVSKEHTGYPTQKPLELLRRIIKASSNSQDMILDPFCGSGTTCMVAEELNRKWAGIDISEKLKGLIQRRFEKEFGIFIPKIVYTTDVPIKQE